VSCCKYLRKINSKHSREEHFSRSPDCAFFTLVDNHKQSPKRTKSKKDRTSKASRLSTQSSLTVASDAGSLGDLAEEGDSILTTATNATTKKMGKAKKATAVKGRKTKAKKDEPVEIAPAPEPEDDDFEVKVDPAPKPTRGRKRKTEDTVDSMSIMEPEAPQPKRRATRTRASVVSNDTMLSQDESTIVDGLSQPKAAKRKPGRPSTRKASAASVVSLRDAIPNDDEIDAALKADLERPLTDDEAQLIVPKKSARASKVANSDHAMFGTEPVRSMRQLLRQNSRQWR